MTKELSLSQFEKVMPKQLKRKVSEDMVDHINSLMTDPLLGEVYRDNLLGFINVMQDGRFKMESYIDGVRYVSFKMAGDSNLQAYIKTFPDRYNTFVANGTVAKDINSYVTSYNKNKLVNLIFEQTLVPTHILNADIYQRAINTQAELMASATSEKVRTDAANSLLHHLKPPETKKIELDITKKEDSSIRELRETTLNLVAEQKRMLGAQMVTAKEIAHTRIITEDGDIVDV